MSQRVSPKRRSRWSAAQHSSPYQTGRPPGALGCGDPRGYYPPQSWELREPLSARRYVERVEEIGDDDEYNTLAAFQDPRGFASDPLFFDGYDLGQNRMNRRNGHDAAAYGELDSEDEDYRESRDTAYALAQSQDDALVRTALERIAHARERGQRDVSLTEEEMEALERSRRPQPGPSTALISPPATPAKKGKSNGSRTAKTKKKSSSGGFFGTSPAKSNSKAKVSRKPSVEQSYATPANAPGVMVAGADGRPVFAPLYYPPPSPESLRSFSSATSTDHPRSRRDTTPPEQQHGYPPPYPSASAAWYANRRRGSSSSSSRGYPAAADEAEWQQHAARQRSFSNHAQPPYLGGYLPPPAGAAEEFLDHSSTGRRNMSGPPEVRYSTLRRVPPNSSPLLSARSLPTATATASHADPAMRGSHLRRVDTNSASSGSSSGEDVGVQIDIVPDEKGGYSIQSSASAASAPVALGDSSRNGGNEARKRRGGGGRR